MADASSLIRRARKSAGFTQNDLAERLGVSQPVVARLERAGSNPKLSTLLEVAAATEHSLKLELERDFGIDESMIAADLRQTPDRRLHAFESFYGFAKEAGGKAY